MPSTRYSRRGILALCGAAAFGGCTALAAPEPDDVVAGVEWKNVEGLRDDRSRTVVTNEPNDPVEQQAPVARELRNAVYDRDVLGADDITIPETGPLVVDDELASRLGDVYDEVSYAVVVTVYERERVVGVPLGNSHGYRLPREAFNRIDPGDRIVVNVGRTDGLPHITRLVDVTSA